MAPTDADSFLILFDETTRPTVCRLQVDSCEDLPV